MYIVVNTLNLQSFNLLSFIHVIDPEIKQHLSKLKKIRTLLHKKTRVTKSLPKDNMFILFMDRKGVIPTHAVPDSQTVDSYYYCKVI